MSVEFEMFQFWNSASLFLEQPQKWYCTCSTLKPFLRISRVRCWIDWNRLQRLWWDYDSMGAALEESINSKNPWNFSATNWVSIGSFPTRFPIDVFETEKPLKIWRIYPKLLILSYHSVKSISWLNSYYSLLSFHPKCLPTEMNWWYNQLASRKLRLFADSLAISPIRTKISSDHLKPGGDWRPAKF